MTVDLLPLSFIKLPPHTTQKSSHRYHPYFGSTIEMAQNNTAQNDTFFGQTGLSLKDWQCRHPAEQEPKTMGHIISHVDGWLTSVQPSMQSNVPPAIFSNTHFMDIPPVAVSDGETSNPPPLTNKVV
jgi:hypothetical protein